MNWKQKRIEELERNLLVFVGLLGEYEKNLVYEDDPIGKEKLKDQIQKLNQEIERSHNKLEKLTKFQPFKGDDSSLEAPYEDIHELLLEETRTFEEAGSSSDILPEDIYNALSEEVKAVVEELKDRLNKAKGKAFTFLLIGRTGVGKSSTLNSLMGAKVAPVHDFDPCTTNVDIHETNLHGAIVRVIDTPGLCDTEGSDNDAQYIELVRQKIPYTIDAVLFVSRLNEPRVDASEQRGLRLITEAFGELFWKKAVIVFTCSDMVPVSRLEEYLDERTKRIHAALSKLQLSNNTVHVIPSVAVDNTNLEKVNPNGQTWIQQLYLTVLDRAEDSSKDVFVLSTSHMLEKIGVAPLDVAEKIFVTQAAVSSGLGGSFLAYLLGVGATSVGTTMGPTGTMLTGTLLISNPIGWAVVLGSAALGGGLMYRNLKKNKTK
jgi:GTPase Era involved in 16S rRNA processing